MDAFMSPQVHNQKAIVDLSTHARVLRYHHLPLRIDLKMKLEKIG